MKKAVIVSFSGIDGSGKTTLAKTLKEFLDNSGISNAYIWCGWRGFESIIFKPIRKVVKKSTNRQEDKQETPKSSKLGLLSFLAVLDYLIRVYPKLVLSMFSKDIIITDRYLHDVIVAFLASNDQFSAKLFKTLSYIFPRPWKILYIDVPVETAYVRKKDIPSLEYLLRQKEMYLEIFRSHENVMSLDGTSLKENLVEIIIQEVLKCQKDY